VPDNPSIDNPDRFRQNPARDLERLAVATVRAWVGDGGTVDDTSGGQGPDFRITYCDGRIGLGEVGWHVDRDVQEMWANTFRHPEHQVIGLRSGLGQWSLQLARGANIGRLYKGLPALIEGMADSGSTRLEIHGAWPTSDIADRARELSIDFLARATGNEPSAAIFFMPSQPGISVPDDPNVIPEWAEAVLLSDAAYADTTKKLLAVPDVDERHVFLMTGSLTDRGVEERLRRIESALPTRPPELPDGITHLWLVAQFGDGPAALWSKETGWTTVVVRSA
jgi:hypothetical protein